MIIMGFLTLTAIIVFAAVGSVSGQRFCRYTSTKANHLTVENLDKSGDIDNESPVQGSNKTCPKATNYCYALWKEEILNGSAPNITILAQGCWESSGSYDCEKNSCISSRKPSKALKDTYFCCCNENFCNEYVSRKHAEVITVSEVPPTQAVEHLEESYLLIIVMVVILALIIITAILMRKDFKRRPKEDLKGNQDSLHLMENGDSYTSNFTVENLRLDGIIGQGRCGAVWKGFVGDQQVAVKIFPAHNKNYFYSELDIYSLPFMTHPSLLTYFGNDERTGFDGNTEYFLFLSLAPNGNLQDYLRSNVIDWDTFCKMALSIARGVAYLHTDIQKGDQIKPCITHRDLNTRNIFVKEDLSCVIGDLGFATRICGSKYYVNGEERHAETKSINDVGTLRYMSPEVLEGAVNLRDCETSLKQIDVYALALVLWEISTRCSDFYPPGVECGPYKMPFEVEMGHPTFEQMQILVCRHKARPLFPDLWRDTPAIKTVKETIEDCWDQDAEARLTALCVEERFHELSGLSERQKSSLFPNGVSPFGRASLVQKDSQNVLMSDNKEGDSCMSESTVETVLAISPGNPQIHFKNSNQFQALCPSVQPYQGRNPCLERNLMPPHNFDANSSELIDKSQKHLSKNLDSSAIVNDYLNLYVSNPTQNLVNPSFNTYSTHSEPVTRPNAPIPFLQNVNTENSCQLPKQSNLPKVPARKMTWRNFMKVFENRRKGSDMSPQIDCNANSNLIVNESGDHLTTPTASLEVALTKGKLETKVARPDMEKLTNQFMDSENRLGVQNAKRPNTLDLPFRYDNRHYDNPLNNIEKSKQIWSPLKCGKRYSLNVNPHWKEERTSKAKSLSGIEELDKKALLEDNPKKNEELKKSIEEMFSMENRSDTQLKDPNMRIKTPGDVPLAVRKIRSERNAARFSLYDDRIMSGHYDETLYTCSSPNKKYGTKFLNSLEDIKFSQNI